MWYVKFWYNNTSSYNPVKSTGIPVDGKRERCREAENTAQKLLISLTENKSHSEIVDNPNREVGKPLGLEKTRPKELQEKRVSRRIEKNLLPQMKIPFRYRMT